MDTIKTAVFDNGEINERLHTLLYRDVGMDETHLASGGTEFVLERCAAVLLVRGGDDLRPERGEVTSAGLTDSGGASGDENDFVFDGHDELPGKILVAVELHVFDDGSVLEDESDGEIGRRFEGFEDHLLARDRRIEIIDAVGDVG